MYDGEVIHLKFKYSRQAIGAVLDRFPAAKILKQSENTYLIEAEVYGKGCLMWILSQGENIELISPKHLKEEIICKLNKMKQVYMEDSDGKNDKISIDNE